MDPHGWALAAASLFASGMTKLRGTMRIGRQVRYILFSNIIMVLYIFKSVNAGQGTDNGAENCVFMGYELSAKNADQWSDGVCSSINVFDCACKK